MITMGFYGGQQDDGFVDNPLEAATPARITMLDTEIMQIVGTISAWNSLNSSQQREVAREVLLRRADIMSYRQLSNLAVNNPNFQQFEIIRTC